MKPLSFYYINENENFSKQIKSYLVDNYGEDEYKNISIAKVIGLLDGLMQLRVTTKEKPINTNPTSLEETPNGWVSLYSKNHITSESH